MINTRRKKRSYGAIDIPAMIVFLTVMAVYVAAGPAGGIVSAPPANAADTDTTADTLPVIVSPAGETTVVPLVASQVSSHTEPVDDKYLEKISQSDILVLLDDGSIAKVPLETYVARVVASEMPSSFAYEALKAQAVAVRTYAEGRRVQFENGSSKHTGAYVCAGTCCQVYRSESDLREVKSDEWYENDFNKIKNAVAETAGELLYYNGELVSQPLFFSSAGGGRTENSEDVFASAVPYLRSVESINDTPEKYTNKTTTLPLQEVMSKVSAYAAAHADSVTIVTESADPAAPAAEVLSRTDGGGAAVVRFGSIALTGRQTRTLFSLPSSDLTVAADADTVTFTTQGSGHRVGLSQYGADGMAQAGYSYKEILRHYYTGADVA